MDVDRPRGEGGRRQKARGCSGGPGAPRAPAAPPRARPPPPQRGGSQIATAGAAARSGSFGRARARPPTAAAAHHRSLLPPPARSLLQGRGFREPTELEDRLQGGQFESLPAEKSGGPGPAKCEQTRAREVLPPPLAAAARR